MITDTDTILTGLVIIWLYLVISIGMKLDEIVELLRNKK